MNELKRMAEIDKMDWNALAEASEADVMKLAPIAAPVDEPEERKEHDIEAIMEANRKNQERMRRERIANNKKTLKNYRIKDK